LLGGQSKGLKEYLSWQISTKIALDLYFRSRRLNRMPAPWTRQDPGFWPHNRKKNGRSM